MSEVPLPSSNQWIAARNRHVQTLRLLANDETVEVGTATAAFKWAVKYLEGLTQRWSAVETPVQLSASEAASFGKTLARSPRRVETPTELEQLRRIDRAARVFVDNFPSTYIDDGNCRKEWRELNDALFDGRPALDTSVCETSTGWRPINTAPKQVAVIVRTNPLTPPVVAYQTNHGEPFKETWRHAGDRCRGEQLLTWPTEWSPLPGSSEETVEEYHGIGCAARRGSPCNCAAEKAPPECTCGAPGGCGIHP